MFQICKQNSYIITTVIRKKRLGYRVVHQELKGIGFKINAKIVLKLMHKFVLLSERIKRKQRYYYVLAIKKENNLNNLLQNNYEAKYLLAKLCTDITYIPFGFNNKKLFFSAVVDLHNREIISYNISKAADVNFVLDILKNIPKLKKSDVICSDRGSVYDV
ncbi:DDE-type integrase/transposase/recombinase ['Fragaria x ananassa' phyllody phytoplasma]|uniref:DDE-type integrase/transposase/recombinase n=1 Tax='Fragaria x ananassa' phyllody phytoplasma TaxID=2358428 RepID=UPI001CEDE948|nr:DDE-type integrase/transposase/recombinase ['Fragaria x ananassa' phyllody phytoplasma]